MNRQNHLSQKRQKKKNFFFFTFVKTAIEANEFPKLIPTTGGSVETTGASALPFGTAFAVIAKDIVT